MTGSEIVRRAGRIVVLLWLWPALLAAQAWITYGLPDGTRYRIEAREGAAPEDLGAALDAVAAGSEDEWVNISPDGSWLLVSTDRFHSDCVGWPCLALVRGDLSAGEAVLAGGAVVHGGFGAVSSDGRRIVWSAGDGAHTLDLWTSTREAEGWSAPLELTAASPFAWNSQPALADDASRVVFDCGDEPYGADGTAICEVAVDGSSLRVLLRPEDGPGGSTANALHHPDYAPDGSVVFEADWYGEQIWRLEDGALSPVRVAEQYTNDNSPCVLGDGRIASLWLNRPGSAGDHELKLMAGDGTAAIMLLTGIDVLDAGLGCATSPASRVRRARGRHAPRLVAGAALAAPAPRGAAE